MFWVFVPNNLEKKTCWLTGKEKIDKFFRPDILCLLGQPTNRGILVGNLGISTHNLINVVEKSPSHR
jgi:hypothetical protein